MNREQNKERKLLQQAVIRINMYLHVIYRKRKIRIYDIIHKNRVGVSNEKNTKIHRPEDYKRRSES